MYKPNPLNTKKITLSTEIEVLSEKLSKNVHEVWAQGRMAEGWKYGKERDDKNKTHPNLVPYDKLSENDKDYDRNTIKETLKLVQKLGFKIKKIEIIGNRKKTCQEIVREITLSLLVIVQILIFILWIRTVEIDNTTIINDIFKYLIFLFFTSFIIFLIVALAKSIYRKEQHREELDLYMEQEDFLRKIKDSEISKKNKELQDKILKLDDKVSKKEAKKL